jgi:hypothetical protein
MRSLRAVLALGVCCGWLGVSGLRAQQAPRTPPRMLHPAAGKQDCLSCHGRGANEHITSVPASHSYGNGACAMCHKPIAEVPKDIPHEVGEARADCRRCHVQGAAAGAAPAVSPPSSHEHFDVSTCRLCHQSAAAQPKPPGSAGDEHHAF